MASKKQRRRREKERRHEYEYVYVDDEGREVAVEEAEPAKSNGGKARTAQSVRTGRGRKIDPPSWRRTLHRAAIFAPLMFVIVYFLRAKDATTVSVLLQVIMLLAFFIPFSYFMDSLMFRLAQRRVAQERRSSPKGSSGRS